MNTKIATNAVTPSLPNLRIRAGVTSSQGKRRDCNEDSAFVSPELDVFIIADGMGGHDAGEVASRFAVDALAHALAHLPDKVHSDEDVETLLRSSLQEAHCVVASLSKNPRVKSAGTTVVLALLFRHHLFVTGVGDSRAYLIREGRIEQLTTDDSVPLMLEKAGVISHEAARSHPWRNRLLSALGMDDFRSDKDIRVIELLAGDQFVLASDGLTDVVDDNQLRGIVSQHSDPQRAADALADRARSNGAGDDVTCLVIAVGAAQSDPPNPSRHSWWERWLGGLLHLSRERPD